MTPLEKQLAEALRKARSIVADRANGGRMVTSRSYAEEVFHEAHAALAEFEREREQELMDKNRVNY